MGWTASVIEYIQWVLVTAFSSPAVIVYVAVILFVAWLVWTIVELRKYSDEPWWRLLLLILSVPFRRHHDRRF